MNVKFKNINVYQMSDKTYCPKGSIVNYLNGGTILNCSFQGNYFVKNGYKVGGIIGTVNSSMNPDVQSRLINCKAELNINCETTTDSIGGIIGDLCYAKNILSPIMKNCLAICNIKCNKTIYGLVGEETNYGNRVIANNNYWDSDICGIKNNIGDNGIGKTTKELKTPSTFTDWNKERLEDGMNIWILKEDEYPRLWFEESFLYLLKQNKYYTIKNNKLTLLENQNLTKSNFEINGFDDLELLNNIDKTDMKLLVYDESNPDKLKLKYTVKESFRPIDKFKGKIKILKQEIK